MGDWVKKITARLKPEHTHRIIAVDPDGLFTYPDLHKDLIDAGYAIYIGKSALELRCFYEQHVRKNNRKIVLVANFPYEPRPDMRKSTHIARIGYQDIFPYFDARALKGLSYNALCTLNELHPYEVLGYDGTIRFLLENLYHVDLQALDASRAKERFLSALITVVFHPDGMNPAVKDYLYNEGKLRLAPLGKDIIEKDTLLAYIQDALEAVAQGKESPCNLLEPLLFKAASHLLTQKQLQARKISKAAMEVVDQRLLPFYYVDENEESMQRLELLKSQLESAERTIQDVPAEWLDLASAIGEAYVLAFSIPQRNQIEALNQIITKLNTRFQDFVDRCYWQMFSLSGSRRPLVVTRVLEYLRALPERRKALLVIDGMNVWQWHQIAAALEANNLNVKTSAIFSYLPSITAWSRQAVFRGSKPDLNSGTEVEQRVFTEYWKARGYSDKEISFVRFGRSTVPDFFDLSTLSGVAILGLACNDLDDLMHASLMGNTQLFNDTQTWVEEAGIVDLVASLKAAGFRCYITSDHGNIEAQGIGSLSMSSRCLSNSRSKRHVEFATAELAKSYLLNNKQIKAGQRETTIFLRDTSAFTSDSLMVTHGGSHLLEMLVPFGIVEQR